MKVYFVCAYVTAVQHSGTKPADDDFCSHACVQQEGGNCKFKFFITA